MRLTASIKPLGNIMTHFTIDYSHYEPEEKKRRAIADCMRYLGGETEYNAVVEQLRRANEAGASPRELMACLCVYLGIEGYPAEVLISLTTKPNTTA